MLIIDTAISSISLIGGLVFCVSLFLQICRIIKIKSTGDLSYGWAILSVISIMLGFIYGIYFNLWPIYIANGIQTVFGIIIIILKIIYDRRNTTRENYTFSI